MHSATGPKSRSSEFKDAVARTYPYVDEDQSDANAQNFIQCIDQARAASDRAASTTGNAAARPFAAIKVTALGDPQLLQRMSELLVAGKVDTTQTVEAVLAEGKAAGWPQHEIGLVENLLHRMDRVCAHAAACDVSIMVDAEQTYFQPAIDFLCLNAMRKYNKDTREGDAASTSEAPVVFQTIQAYRTDSFQRLQRELGTARSEGFRFGLKLVRGAYMQMERQRAKQMGYPDPIWPTLDQTHANYARCLTLSMDAVSSQGASLLVASHNQASVLQATRMMADRGLNHSSPVFFGQLLGMSDFLTFSLAGQGFRAYK